MSAAEWTMVAGVAMVLGALFLVGGVITFTLPRPPWPSITKALLWIACAGIAVYLVGAGMLLA